MTLHRPIPHRVTVTAPARAATASRASRSRHGHGDTVRPVEDIALSSFQPGAAGRMGKMAFVVGAATLSWAGVFMIARAAFG